MSQPILARCRAATKNANAAQLLYRIAYWMPRARIKHRGKTWVANSADQWCEQTGLTIDQYRRSIALLRRLCFVHTEQHLFGGKNVTHVRLTNRACKAIAQVEPLQSASTDLGKSASAKMSETAQLHIQGVSAKEILHQNPNTALANAIAYGDHDHFMIPEKISKSLMSVYDELKSDPDTDTTQALWEKGGHESPGGLAKCWAVTVKEVYGDYVPPPTTKELAQFKAFVSACPKDTAFVILRVCLMNWPDFSNDAKLNYSAFPVPTRPTLGFLLKYKMAAINFALANLKPKPAPVPVQQAADLPMPVSLPGTSSKPKHIPATKEECLAILADED